MIRRARGGGHVFLPRTFGVHASFFARLREDWPQEHHTYNSSALLKAKINDGTTHEFRGLV